MARQPAAAAGGVCVASGCRLPPPGLPRGSWLLSCMAAAAWLCFVALAIFACADGGRKYRGRGRQHRGQRRGATATGDGHGGGHGGAAGADQSGAAGAAAVAMIVAGEVGDGGGGDGGGGS